MSIYISARLSLFASHTPIVVLLLNHHLALLTMGKVFTQVNETEHRLVKIMAKEGTQWTKIQRITARSVDTISNILKSKGVSQGSGAPVRFSAKDFDKVLKVIVAMVKKADAQSEVTMAMIKDKANVKVSDRTVRNKMSDSKYAF